MVTAVDEEGIRISWSGFAKRVEMAEAVSDLGVRARFFVGRLERGSAEVGMDSGIDSDMLICKSNGPFLRQGFEPYLGDIRWLRADKGVKAGLVCCKSRTVLRRICNTDP